MTINTFPSTPTLAWSVQKVPNWGTRFQRAVSGRELRVTDYALPIYTFVLTFEFLRDSWDQRMGFGVGPAWMSGVGGSPPFNDLRTIWEFYNQQNGPAIPFLFTDPSDNTTRFNATVPQVGFFATGDGITQTFQMASPLLAPVVPTGVFSVSPSAGGYSIGTDTGQLFFSLAPTLGTPIGADFTYAYKVRFSDDSLPAENFLFQLWNMRQLKLTSVLY